VLNEKLKETEQAALYYHVEEPLSAVLADMERRGFQVDREGLATFSEELGQMCRDYAEAIYFEAGHEFNINSPKQLGEVLFGELKLPVAKKTKTGYSTDAETLEKLRPYHTIVDRILEYRQVAKLKSTYGDGLLKVADENGRIHSSFNQTVTATGRLSSSEPNLQNIPIRTELGRRMRQYFIPKNEDYVLVDADYSQIELRLLAAISGDENMIAAFASGEDIHTVTASQVFGVPVEGVTSELRKQAKAVNFGIVYGIGAYSLSQDLGVPKYEADRYIKSYLAKYPQVSSYLDDIVESAKAEGFVTTIFGRRRYIPELASPKKNLQAFGARVAMNSPIQGAAADIIKIAMIRVDKALRESGMDASLILQVHDELILEAHKSCALEAAALLKREMEAAVDLVVPLTVEVGVGEDWLACH
jgi:DNA polymerase-1